MRNSWRQFNMHLWAILFAIALILGLFLIAVRTNAQDINFYNQFQRENEIAKETNRSQDELDIININIVFYLQSGENALLAPDFSEKEVRHMEDVYVLYRKTSVWMNLSLTFVMFSLAASVFLRKQSVLLNLALRYIAIIMGIILIIVIIISTDFNRYWNLFHHIFFDNDLWLLDPATDLMIQMMPLSFFMTMTLNILKQFLIMLAFISLAILWNKYINRENKECKLCNTKETE